MLHQPASEPESPTPPPAENTVKGTVVDRDRKGVADAKVTLSGPKRDTVRTDTRGSFFFTGPAGNYQITVEAGGKAQTFTATIVDARLEPDSFTFGQASEPSEPPGSASDSAANPHGGE